MKQIINQILQEKLDKAVYSSDRAAVLTKEISDAVKAQLKGEATVRRYCATAAPLSHCSLCWHKTATIHGTSTSSRLSSASNAAKA
jgi:hypothetical protein